MSSSLLKRFEASRESAPVESPLDKPASIHDDAGKVVAAVEPAVPATAESSSGPGLHAPGLPAEPVTKPVDATGVAKDESADKNVVAAVKPAVPSSSTASGLPAEPVKEAKSNAAAVADDKADAEGKTVAAVQSVTPHHANEALAIVMEARTAAALEWMMEDKHGVQISVPVRSQAHHGHLADYFDKLANDPAEKAKKNHDGIPGIHSEADMHRSMADYHRKLSKGIDPAKEDLDPEAAQVQPATCIVPMPDHARETEAAYRAVEEATLSHAAEELDRVQNGLEGLRDRIDAANATGGLSAESAFFASFAVESLLKRFEIEDKAVVGSFESAVVVPDGKTVVSTEALTTALEAVDGFGKRLRASFVRTLNPVWTRVKMLDHSLTSIVEQAKKVKINGKRPTIEVKSKLIAEGDETSKDLNASFSKAAEVLKYMVNGFGRQAEQDYRANMDLMWKHVYKRFSDPGNTGSTADLEGLTVEEITKAMEEIAAGWKDPRVKLGGDVTKPLVGNWQLFAEEKDEDSGAEYRGSNAAVKKLKDLAYKAYPTMAGSAHADGDANSGVKVEVPALSPQEIVKIAQALQSATANFSAWKAFVEKISGATTLAAVFGPAAALMAGPYALPAFGAWMVILFSKTIKRSTHTTGSEMQELHILWHAQNTANRLRLHVGYDAGLVLTHIGNAFVKIAKQSLNAYAKASVEAFDRQSLESEILHKEATDKDIEAAEKSVGFKFDPAYRNFLKKHGGTVAGRDELFGVAKDLGHLDATKEYHALKGRAGYPAQAMPVASYGNGHHYVVYDQGTKKVTLWADGGIVRTIGSSLDEFARSAITGSSAEESFDQQNSLDGVSVNETAPNEPVQMPAEGHTATEKELMAKQDSWEDKPASFQTIEDEVGAEAIDFDGAVNACESLMDEADEIAILSQHYATEAEASGEAKPHPGMVERIKAWVAKIGEFFRSVWKRIVAFVTQQGNRLMDWASRLRKHHFEKVTVKITGAQDAYINDMKLPNLSPFYEFMDEAAGAGETLATKLEAFNASGGYQGTSDGKTLDHRAKAIDANAAFMNIHTDTPIPAEGLVGAFKLSIEDGKLVETQVVKKIGEDREYTVTGSSLASFVEGAARLIKKAEARAKAFEMKSDADWKKAKVAADTLVSSNGGLFNLKLYGESARFLMKAFSVLQSWARAVGNFAEECIKGAGSKLRKNERDDIVDAKFTPAAEARADLPYWYHPAEA